ncbi:MAG TPA: 4Fe-4S dicluster domain-containing protein [Burkholderiaceae bacterium]|nr:4Fe-4S dicluster domain-containing protein [Burkholderiaceae bacterium]HMX10621.1 4Fe-4S dicluster domain-containing protein [Burkholderiaceae bacterium]HMY98523.1 4Fe-4S dicluster domain-containing protein [Burkholderiaceae bacterium]HNG79696.1 4Fe-4S dicluster domain-containing protein [Burkholderiaceae bacterium]
MAAPGRPIAVVDPARCTGCGRCVGACPPHVLWLERQQWRKTATLGDAAGCTGCGRCVPPCPFRAITLHRPPLVSP